MKKTLLWLESTKSDPFISQRCLQNTYTAILYMYVVS